MTDRLLTTKEAARFLGASISFLEKDRWAGATIPFIRIGSRAIRYRAEDLEAFIESRRKVPHKPFHAVREYL